MLHRLSCCSRLLHRHKLYNGLTTLLDLLSHSYICIYVYISKQGVFLPYAQWLAHNDRFDAALDAYRKAGRPDLSLQTMEQLIYNAVIKQQFKDAAYYYWLSGQEAVKALKGGEQESWDKVTYMFK
jgi:hypothetical protein